MKPAQPASIITFYSYKGGTGRSMALANVAWILALQGKRVLTIDWDVEAPGLHRYFRPFLIDKDLRSSAGLIDFVVAFAGESVKPAGDSLAEDWYVEHADISAYAIALEWDFPGGGSIDFVPAGRQDATYATRVSTFNWQNFYENLGGGALIDAMRRLLRERDDYDYVLIDSRTGVSDTAGICTVQLPDTLVCCFTYNNQSTDGAAAIAASAQEIRRRPEYARGGLRDLVVFPVPMRVDPFESERLKVRREYAWTAFDPVIAADVIPLSVRRNYWTEVEVPYIAAFSYEEQLAIFLEEPTDPKSIAASLLRMAGYVFGPESRTLPDVISPKERQRVLTEFSQTAANIKPVAVTRTESPDEAAARRAETIYQRLSAGQQEIARALWLAIVRVTELYETAGVGSFRVREADLPPEHLTVAVAFIEGGVLTRDADATIALASPAVLASWVRLRTWTDESREFLKWRQRLRSKIEDQRSSKSKTDLLRGAALSEAKRWQNLSQELLPFEREFIERSRRRRRGQILGGLTPVIALAFLVYLRFVRQVPVPATFVTSQSALSAEAIVKKALSLDDPLQTALVLAEVKTEPANAKKYIEQARAKLESIPRVVLRGHTDAIRSIDFSLDDTLLLTASDDGKAGLWGASAGDLRAWLPISVNGTNLPAVNSRPEPPRKSVPGARFFDANTIYTLGNDANIRLFDAAGRAFTLIKARDGVRLAGVDRNKKSAVLFWPDGRVVVEFLSRAQRAKVIRPSSQPLRLLAVAPGILAALGTSGLSFWTLEGNLTGVNRKTLAETTVMTFGDGPSPKSQEIVLYAEDEGRVWIVPPNATESTAIFVTPLKHIVAMTIAPFGGNIVLGNEDGVTVVCTRADGKIVARFYGHRSAITDLQISHDGRWLATASTDGTVRVWSGESPVVPKTFIDIAKSITTRTTACLAAEERSLLLGETAADAQTKAAACEKQHGRVSVHSAQAAGV